MTTIFRYKRKEQVGLQRRKNLRMHRLLPPRAHLRHEVSLKLEVEVGAEAEEVERIHKICN